MILRIITFLIIFFGSKCLGVIVSSTFTTKPYFLAANGMIDSYQKVQRPPGIIAITSINFDVLDLEGNSVLSSIYLHHIVLDEIPSYSFMCPKSNARGLAGVGNATTPMKLPSGYAMIIGSEPISSWYLIFDVINELDMDMNVTMAYYITYDTDITGYQNVIPLSFNVLGCDHGVEFNVTGNGGPNSVATQSATVTAPFTGMMLLFIGHLHNGGIALAATDVTTGNVLCKTIPTYDNNDPATGNIVLQSECNDVVEVFVGDQIVVEAWYDNSIPRIGVMGLMISWVVV